MPSPRSLNIFFVSNRLSLYLQINRSSTTSSSSWNTQLRELARQGQYEQGLHLYRQMLHSPAAPNAFTFPFALKSSAALSLPTSGEQLHCHVIKTGCHDEPFVQTALISMYCKCCLVGNARKLFDESPQSKQLTVCYNALISGYTQNSQFSNAVALFCQMRLAGVAFNSVTMLGLIPGCTIPMHLVFGMSLHCCNVKSGLASDLSAQNCLLTMYVRCGSVELARRCFDGMPEKGLITWNAMISGYAQSGLATHVLDLYREMESSGIGPDAVTLVGVLSCCANLGAQKVGREVEQKIERNGVVFDANDSKRKANKSQKSSLSRFGDPIYIGEPGKLSDKQ
ncbi:hypothetical protein RJ639_044277 [Escallonia herrerae]|uniref:Pentatricopeptide repeat-containing protein n=1 Tax=Escallonia herrerae TaxID=1293975 RepID=A0AA89B955_9ASTE|nr:hypothetical protein RJ639_044277 [Escallonia herrerae]